FELEPDHFAPLATPQLALHRLQEILNVVFLDGEIGVANHAKRGRLAQLQPGKESFRVRRDHVLEKNEARRLDREQTRYGLRNPQHDDVRLATLASEDDGEIQREIGDERKWMSGIDCQRREDR